MFVSKPQVILLMVLEGHVFAAVAEKIKLLFVAECHHTLSRPSIISTAVRTAPLVTNYYKLGQISLQNLWLHT